MSQKSGFLIVSNGFFMENVGHTLTKNYNGTYWPLNTGNKQWKLHRYSTVKNMLSFKISKLSTTDNILNGKPCNILYTGYLNKDISFNDIVYFEPMIVKYKKQVNGTIDQLKVSLIDGDGNEILSNFKISIALHIV